MIPAGWAGCRAGSAGSWGLGAGSVVGRAAWCSSGWEVGCEGGLSPGIPREASSPGSEETPPPSAAGSDRATSVLRDGPSPPREGLAKGSAAASEPPVEPGAPSDLPPPPAPGSPSASSTPGPPSPSGASPSSSSPYFTASSSPLTPATVASSRVIAAVKSPVRIDPTKSLMRSMVPGGEASISAENGISPAAIMPFMVTLLGSCARPAAAGRCWA